MSKGRVEAFSDGVLAILITIMVLELKVPEHAGWEALRPLAPVFCSYVLSFVYLGIYWNNHHHMFHLVTHVTGPMLWANLHLLFWLSLVPFVTAWIPHGGSLAAALYGLVLLLAAIAWTILQAIIIKSQGPQSRLRAAVGGDRKGKLSTALYACALPLAFLDRWISFSLYAIVALMWLVPDRRFELAAEHADSHGTHGRG